MQFCHSIFIPHVSLSSDLYKDDEMKEPWDTRGCYQRMGAKKQFEECARCGHSFIDWVRKSEIEEENKQLKRKFDRLITEHNEKKQRGIKGLKKPTVESRPLLIRCNCHKNYHAAYNSTCPNKCGDGSCELCNCSCSFVVTVNNYNAVRIASMNPQKPRKSNGEKDEARAFLIAGAQVRESAAVDARDAYHEMVADGRLDGSKSGRKEIAAAIARQSSLITAQHYVNNPPAHCARSGLHDKMMSLEHKKGPSWIRRDGTDVNLGGSGDQRRSSNNRLTSIVELQEESDDDISIKAVSGAKGVECSARRESVARMPLPPNFPFSTFSSPVEKMIRRTRSRANKMMLDNKINKSERKKACTVRTALAKRDNSYISIVEDSFPTILRTPPSSQDVLNACLTQASLEQNN